MLSDKSLHAEGLASTLGSLMTIDVRQGNCQLLIGRYEYCLQYLKNTIESNEDVLPTLMTDDAASNQLCSALHELGIPLHEHQFLVAALRPVPKGKQAEAINRRYQQQYDELPGSYFWETITALQLASLETLPSQKRATTVLGEVCFSEHRELSLRQFTLLQCEADGFVERLSTPVQEATALAAEFRNILSARRLIMPQQPQAEKDFNREVTKRWAKSFAGDMPEDVAQKDLNQMVTEFSPEGTIEKPPLFYLHGGGMVYYDVPVFAPLLAHMAKTLDCSVVAFDYHKLPEHSVQYSIEALIRNITPQFLRFTQRPRLAGDSVGGLLALYLADWIFSARFAELVLIYPVLSLYRQYPSYQTFGHDVLLDGNRMRWFSSLFRPYFRQQQFDAMTLSAERLEKLPPIKLFSAGCDVLGDESKVFANRLKALGIALYHHCFKDLPHDFCLYRGKLSCAEQAVNQILTELIIGENPHEH